ncbi:hypothetical protein ACXR0O_09110 [Verrucomicrobiota bacterium sgz303538]
MKAESIRGTAVKIFLPTPTILALILVVVLGVGKIAALLAVPLFALTIWVTATAPSAASFAARSVFFGIVYGLLSLCVAACAFGVASAVSIEDCSFRQCFVPTVGWTIFYCWIIFVFCGVLFSGASARINSTVAS